MKKLLSAVILFFLVNHSCAQKISAANYKFLQKKEDSLKLLADKILNGRSPEERFNADSLFTRVFVRALVTPHSFHFPFDSLESISKLSPPDSSFRIFTWQLVLNDDKIRQHGAIQMRTSDGSLKLFPLIDRSDNTKRITDTIGNNRGWIGAIYYKILQRKNGSQDFYTLLGYDEYSIRSNRKIIEVLQFNNDEPVFGSRIFSFEEDTIFKSSISRFVMEYKKEAGARLTYDRDMDMIIYEHLVSENGQPEKRWTYVGDGDYEGFKWKNGKWIHVEKVFNYVTPLDQEPVPMPIRDVNGNIDENKIKNNGSEEEKVEEKPVEEKPKPATNPKPKTPVKKKSGKG